MEINKVIEVLLDPDQMEEVNKITGLNEFATDNWCDGGTFAMYQELYSYVSKQEATALINGDADYIAFRLDV